MRKLTADVIKLAWKFPVTVMLVVQYVPFVIGVGYINGTPETGFIAKIVLIAVGSAFAAECVISPLRKSRRQWAVGLATPARPNHWLASGARRVAVVSMATTVLSAAIGLGSYATGIATQERSALEPILSPFRSWPLISIAFLLAAWKAASLNRSQCIRWIGGVSGVATGATLFGGYAPYTFVLVASIAVTAIGLFRFRVTAALLAVCIAAWPLVATVRNDIRLDAGAYQYSGQYDAGRRLRMDLLMAPASHLDVPVDVGQATFEETVRYGVLPRFLDPGRPTVATGRLLNQFFGGSSVSSYSLLTVGNVWLLTGAFGLTAFHVLVVVYLALLLSGKPGPAQLAAALLAAQDFVLMTSTYPDVVSGHIQALISLGAATLLARVSLKANRAEAAHA